MLYRCSVRAVAASQSARRNPLPARRFVSAKSSSTSTSTASPWARYGAVVGAVSVPAIWWLTTSPRSRTAPASGDGVPDLGSPPPGAEQLHRLAVNAGPSSPDEVTRLLSDGAFSFPVHAVAGVARYDGAQLASNSPCEDRFFHGAFPSPWPAAGDGSGDSRWMAWAVLDGHAGWQTADVLTRALLPYVQQSLRQAAFVTGGRKAPPPDDQVVQRAVARGFVDLDAAIFGAAEQAAAADNDAESLADKVAKVLPACAGSCALLSLYDPASRTLHVACTGDSRAVLGRRRTAANDGPSATDSGATTSATTDDAAASSGWVATPLSTDQTGSNADEIARVHAEHPGEEDGLVKDGRVLGLMVSRAFGDGRWKWPVDFQKDIRLRFFAPHPLPPERYAVRTPPYLTAEPVVTSTRLRPPAEPAFLILATDGFWDNVSNEQAVELVGRWLEARTGKNAAADTAVGSPAAAAAPARKSFDFGEAGRGTSGHFTEDNTTVQDANAAVHLVRNSLGGRHHELVAGRLAVAPPFSRRARDDITVQVVFFNIDGL